MSGNRVIDEKDGCTTARNNLNESGGPTGHLKSLKARTARLQAEEKAKVIR